MKKILCSSLFLILSLNIQAQSIVLTHTFIANSGSITCASPSVNVAVSASNYTNGVLSYSWAGPGSTATGSNVLLGTAGQYSITASDSQNGLSFTTLLSIGIDTTTPTSLVTPTLQVISCNVAAITISTSVNSPASGVIQNFYSQYTSAPAFVNGNVGVYGPNAPGVYTTCATNTVNGCSTCHTFSMATNDQFPNLSIASVQNFSLGCSPLNTVSINLTANSPSGVTFSLISPYTSSPVPPNYILSLPGTYTAAVKDLSAGCVTEIPFSIIDNAINPDINFSAATLTLTCFTPSVLIQGTSTNSSVAFHWSIPGNSSIVNGSTLAVQSTPNITQNSLGTYTLTVFDSQNSCSSTQTLAMYQVLNKPHALITTNYAFITCSTPTLNLNNSSSSTIPQQFNHSGPVSVYLWEGPSPQPTISSSTNYSAYTPGIYTLTAQDQNNGCMSTATVLIMDSRIYPLVTSPPPFNIQCPNPTATISAYVSSSQGPLSYQWILPQGATSTSPWFSSPTLVVSSPGIYLLIVTNPSNGCSTSATVAVEVCTGIENTSYENNELSIYPNPSNGAYIVSFTEPIKNITLEVYNSLGDIIHKELMESKKIDLDLKNQPSGIYFINLKNETGSISTSKIIKQ